ncbi:hypothetical protein NRS6186_09370 [Bacillus subtilis]|nr:MULTISPECIES: hypothetical protein [Bacillus]AOL29693.1 hypothetical protein BGM20_03195 [Alkalicoccobacillus gibsonii]AOL27384.1 hypothetical protein BGM23_12655 [Bacillus sp. FJAT-14266]KKJ80624.1 hypothetical protein NG20_16565 [Bacillus subtilis]KOS71926.1 hypothetical protein AEA11_05635 [Bacillus subtilis]MBG9460939.1 hypothetical protein [Bacillus subtilis]
MDELIKTFGVLPTALTAAAAIIVPFITFILGRINEDHKVKFEYRTFMVMDEITGKYHLKNAPFVKKGSKLLLPKSYESLEKFIIGKRLDQDENFTDVSRFNYLQVRTVGKSIITGGYIKIKLGNDDESIIETSLPFMLPDDEVYIPLDITHENVTNRKYGIKRIDVWYQLQTGQRMKYKSVRSFKEEENETIIKDSHSVKKFHLYYWKIQNLRGKNMGWYYLNLNKSEQKNPSN